VRPLTLPSPPTSGERVAESWRGASRAYSELGEGDAFSHIKTTLPLARQFRRQACVGHVARGGKLAAHQALRLAQVRGREVGAVEPRHAQVSAAQVRTAQTRAVEERAAK